MRETRDAHVKFCVTTREREAWRAAAKADGRTLSAWIRWVLNQEVARLKREQSESEAA